MSYSERDAERRAGISREVFGHPGAFIVPLGATPEPGAEAASHALVLKLFPNAISVAAAELVDTFTRLIRNGKLDPEGVE